MLGSSEGGGRSLTQLFTCVAQCAPGAAVVICRDGMGVVVLLRPRLLASISILTASLCAGVWAQAPEPPSPGSDTPAASTPETPPKSADTRLPPVQVTARRKSAPK